MRHTSVGSVDLIFGKEFQGIRRQKFVKKLSNSRLTSGTEVHSGSVGLGGGHGATPWIKREYTGGGANRGTGCADLGITMLHGGAIKFGDDLRVPGAQVTPNGGRRSSLGHQLPFDPHKVEKKDAIPQNNSLPFALFIVFHRLFWFGFVRGKSH